MRPHQSLEEMYAFYVFGASLSHVGRRHGMSSANVKRMFRDAALPVRNAEEATSLYNAGGNDAADVRIAEFLDRQESAVAHDAAPADLVPPALLEELDAETEESAVEFEWRIAALHELGWPVATIAQALGVGKRTVRESLRRCGLSV